MMDKMLEKNEGPTARSVVTGPRIWSAVLQRSKKIGILYLLLLPTLTGIILFNFYPKFTAIKYSFFRWDGGTSVEEFRGIRNFIDAFTADPLFWKTFQLVGILLVANLVKMWPSIFTAIAIHRLRSRRMRYAYRVLFVIPMIIPGLVWLLIWKSFYDPTVGILNKVLNVTGLMKVLAWLDHAMPQLAHRIGPVHSAFINPVFGSVWGMVLFGVLLLSLVGGFRGVRRGWAWWLVLLPAAYALWGPVRGLITVAAVLAGGLALSRGITGRDWLKRLGGGMVFTAFLVILATMIWTKPVGVFTELASGRGASPAWLGHTRLIIPALIFWGFPWVGTVGVLIYLAGLQNISQDVYEAADLDGVGPVGKLFRIELPLIMTQVRINLILLTIHTLTSYGLFLILLGPDGGPGNKGMVPGLYMYREAFFNQRFGYACALGMVLFVILLGMTILYQKYVRVEK